MAFFQDLPWHAGEIAMAKAMKVPNMDNPTVPMLSPQLANHSRVVPLIAIGTLDKQGRPWTTLWGGEKGISQPIAQGILGIRSQVVTHHDPVVEELVGKEGDGTVVREEGVGRMVSGLTIDLETRKRTKLFGRMVAGALTLREDEATDSQQSIAEVQLVLKIEQSLGNCPKYLNKKHIEPAVSNPELVSDSPQLPQRALDLLSKADLFFLSSANNDLDMDTNHRGGPAGFVRVMSNEASGAVLCYPEYSGNRLYQTLGNLKVNPALGICVPDFDTGDMLYLTGTTEVLIGPAAASILPRSNLAVKITVTSARFVATALPFRGTAGELSPYNPTVRHLASEKSQSTTANPTPSQQQQQQATLLLQTPLTPTISRFKFALSNPTATDITTTTTHQKPGQYVTLDFASLLDIGYSHMRDDDPRSLNDDFVRTFTVSSPPPGTNNDSPSPVLTLKDNEFEITVRRVGTVTEELFKHGGSEKGDRTGLGLEVGVKGFGGEFEVRQDGADEVVAFVAAGVGITPLLACLGTLDLQRLRLFWTVRNADIGLVRDVLEAWPALAERLMLFVTNVGERGDEGASLGLEIGTADVADAVDVRCGRMLSEDVRSDDVRRYYLCTGTGMRRVLMGWLSDKELVFEDFNF
jgi:NAD(P)H-flavin reductase